MPGRRLLIVALLATLLLSSTSVAGTASPPAASTASAAGQAAQGAAALQASGGRLTNDCRVSRRGVPRCGGYLGMAYGGNADPSRLERRVGRLGVRRTFFRHDQIGAAVRTARADAAAGRLPWVSFKFPHKWWRMARGDGDAWARKVARSLKRVDGPVWVAFHHEPEGDGFLRKWRKTQERLAPIVRRKAGNVAFTVILTGWHQFYGKSSRSLKRIWPRGTKIDVAGFDIYNAHGLVKRGKRLGPTDMDGDYFAKISRWAKRKGVRWGLAETGYTDYAARRTPQWIDRTHRRLVKRGGVAMSYFNSKLNSVAPWHLEMPVKEEAFTDALEGTARLPVS
ncbi:hypothetical protein KUV85_00605 [Nocardioides panacisoli]|uniref:hypothetical protein n=1 Tax=Nocardioides panacisoli TaxID=627624 RepID=UPI001C6307A9|nr:hypothetical protein [Nocardioides panacisoli]QYJ04214.1 hypothetical protein KUV85_00605 [Nocardioides panacisoli]